VPEYRRFIVAGFIEMMFKFYAELNYAYLEINPFVVVADRIVPLDLAARIDDTAEFESGALWGDIEFPAPFGRELTPEEKYIKELDAQTGASLKLTVLNPRGRVWTMVAGGGASVIYTDTVSDLGFGSELANYGEYSGDPSEQFTYEYAKTILDLMTREKDPRGKVLIIGGGIANFTNVAATFKGIVRALKEYQTRLQENDVKIYVRRGGPNYQEGLRIMRDLGQNLGVPIEVFGPETHITSIVPMALEVGK
jgi:ATP citrate (pro-S)-lyase